MDKIQVITLSVLTLSVVYMIYLNYKKNSKMTQMDYKIKMLENEFYKLDKKISEIPTTFSNQTEFEQNNMENMENMVNTEMLKDLLRHKEVNFADEAGNEKNKLETEIQEKTETQETNNTYEELEDNCITDVLNSELKQEFNEYIMKTGEFDSSDEEEQIVYKETEQNILNQQTMLDKNYNEELLNTNLENTDLENTDLENTDLENTDLENDNLNNEVIEFNTFDSSDLNNDTLNNTLSNDNQKYSEQTLNEFTVKQLKNIARENKLMLKGNKQEIIDRIVANI